MRIVFRLFGFPIATVDVMQGSFAVEEEEGEGCHIEGGSAHNFERDVNPISPEDRYDWEWEDRKRGFGFRT
jgi:hypothetical protein